MKNKIYLIIIIIILFLVNTIQYSVADDNELYLNVIGDNELGIIPEIGDNELNIIFHSEQDTTLPVINIESPLNGTSLPEGSFYIYYNVSDNNDITYCTLDLDGVNTSDTTITKNITQAFNVYKEMGSYQFGIYCYDGTNLGYSGSYIISLTRTYRSGAPPITGAVTSMPARINQSIANLSLEFENKVYTNKTPLHIKIKPLFDGEPLNISSLLVFIYKVNNSKLVIYKEYTMYPSSSFAEFEFNELLPLGSYKIEFLATNPVMSAAVWIDVIEAEKEPVTYFKSLYYLLLLIPIIAILIIFVKKRKGKAYKYNYA